MSCLLSSSSVGRLSSSPGWIVIISLRRWRTKRLSLSRDDDILSPGSTPDDDDSMA